MYIVDNYMKLFKSAETAKISIAQLISGSA